MALTKVKAGNILLTTPGASSNDVTPATTAYVTTALANLADSAPSTLDTLNELAAALGDDANFSTTVTNSIALKAPLASPTFTGTLEIPNLTISSAQGSDGQVLTSTGSGIAWEAVPAGTTINNNADNRVITGSGTADTLNGEANLTYDGSTLSLGAATGAKRFLVYDGSGSNNLYVGFGIDAPSSNDFTMYASSTGLLKFGKMATDGSTITTHMAIDNSGDVTMSSTGSLRLPNGTTAQRPTGANGMIRYNTTLGAIEEFRASAWKTISDAFSATGGTKTTSGSYTYHTFTSSGSITFSGYTGTKAIDILVVAGGGGGGNNSNIRAAGGGAGGLIFIQSYPALPTTYTVSVGSGGAEGASGTNSAFSVSGGTALTAIGGGMGGYNDSTDNGADGGSGGGNWYPGYAGASGTQPANTNDGSNTYNSTGFGNDGGTSGATQPYGSGGGGAGGVGASFNSGTPAVGGVGKDMSAYFGTSVGENGWFAGGGGAGSYPPQGDVKYVGGTGGGGRGWNNGTETAQNGTANTGGGGGAGGSGGSGIIILRYLT
jgi:hypothetical protein